MHDLKTIKEINRLTKLAKSRRVSRSLNNVRGNHKDAEKGRLNEEEIRRIQAAEFLND